MSAFAFQMKTIARDHASMVTHLRVRAGAKTRACGASFGARVDDPAAVTCAECKDMQQKGRAR